MRPCVRPLNIIVLDKIACSELFDLREIAAMVGGEAVDARSRLSTACH